MLFINPGNIKEPELISELPAHIRRESPPEDSQGAAKDSPEETPPGEDTPAEAPKEATPTAIQLAVLLQDILFLLENHESGAVPLAVVVSAWDVVADCEGPEQCVKEHLPLLWQYLYTHRDQLDVLYYGISAQGGRLNSEEETERLLEKHSAAPVKRILVVDSAGERLHDITLPLWNVMHASVEM
jgi:hypothetical protein